MPDDRASTAPPPTGACPLSRQAVIDRYFLEHRAKLIDIAAFLDRIDRAAADGAGDQGPDHRMIAFRRALALVADGQPERARRILELFSDPTDEPIPAAGTKGATGAWPGTASSTARTPTR